MSAPFLERKGREPFLSKHEMAKALREEALDMFEFGVVASDKKIPHEVQRGAVKIPVLLHYSPEIRNHYQTLVGVLNSPREFQIVERPEMKWNGNLPDGDVIYEDEGNGDVYTFTHHLTSPYLNGLAAGLDKLQKMEPWLWICLRRFKDGVWSVHYGYSEGIRYNIFDVDYVEGSYPIDKKAVGRFAKITQPQRTYLVNFVFSAQPLKTAYFIKMGFAPLVEPFLHETGRKRVGAFEVHQIGFDAKGMAEKLQREDGYDPRPGVKHSHNSRHIYALKKDGNREFSIVKLGVTQIGNQAYHIYSSSEQPFVREQVIVPRTTAFLRRNFIPAEEKV